MSATAFVASPVGRDTRPHPSATLPQHAAQLSQSSALALPASTVAGTVLRPGCSVLGLFALAYASRQRRTAAAKAQRRRTTGRVARRAAQSEQGEEGGGDLEDLIPFELRGFSLAKVGLGAGVALIILAFADYFGFGQNGGFGFGGILFIYAAPVFLLGAALAYAELQPVEVDTLPGAEGLYEKLATPTLRKIVKDVTRHRYGDDAHLDSSLKALGLTTSAGKYPQMRRIILSRSATGELEFTMLFESKDVPFTTWSDPMKIVACDRFFGPGLWTEIYKYDAEKRIAALKLTTGVRPPSEPAPAPAPAVAGASP